MPCCGRSASNRSLSGRGSIAPLENDMTTSGIFQIALYFLVIVAIAKPMGAYMARVFSGERTFLHRVFRPLEAAIYRICGIDEAGEQHWTRYAGSLLLFSLVSLLFTYLLLRMQQWFPWNPQGL